MTMPTPIKIPAPEFDTDGNLMKGIARLPNGRMILIGWQLIGEVVLPTEFGMPGEVPRTIKYLYAPVFDAQDLMANPELINAAYSSIYKDDGVLATEYEKVKLAKIDFNEFKQAQITSSIFAHGADKGFIKPDDIKFHPGVQTLIARYSDQILKGQPIPPDAFDKMQFVSRNLPSFSEMGIGFTPFAQASNLMDRISRGEKLTVQEETLLKAAGNITTLSLADQIDQWYSKFASENINVPLDQLPAIWEQRASEIIPLISKQNWNKGLEVAQNLSPELRNKIIPSIVGKGFASITEGDTLVTDPASGKQVPVATEYGLTQYLTKNPGQQGMVDQAMINARQLAGGDVQKMAIEFGRSMGQLDPNANINALSPEQVRSGEEAGKFEDEMKKRKQAEWKQLVEQARLQTARPVRVTGI